jgi:hypothetical protein
MISMLVKIDRTQVDAMLARLQGNVAARALANALSGIADETRDRITAALPEVFDRPTPWTMKAIGSQRASTSSLTSRVFVKPAQATYLRWQIAGGTRYPPKRAIVLPTDYPVDPFGNIPRGAVKKLLARPDVFSGTVRGIPGIWQRQGRRLILLISYEPKATYRRLWNFAEDGMRIIRRIAPMHVKREIASALRA